MNQAVTAYSTCHSIFHDNAEAPTAETYTQLWINLINQIERGKQALSPFR